jgi:2-iminobutanoate/2-iminopropanoate deaminase
MKKIISTRNAPAAIGPYSQATEAGGFLFISGQLPMNAETGNMDAADIKAQTETALKNLEGILASEGLTLEHVVKTTVFMADLGLFAKNPPARATIEVKALPKAALVEIEAIAAR